VRDEASPLSGTVCLLSADRITPVASPPTALLKCMKRLGVGSASPLQGTSVQNPS